jgi:hypothetical protein
MMSKRQIAVDVDNTAQAAYITLGDEPVARTLQVTDSVRCTGGSPTSARRSRGSRSGRQDSLLDARERLSRAHRCDRATSRDTAKRQWLPSHSVRRRRRGSEHTAGSPRRRLPRSVIEE